MRPIFHRRGLWLVAASVGVLAFAGGVAYATIGGGGVINGCYQKQTGALRVIDTQANATCLSTETAISWSQQGPPGPPGPSGDLGGRIVANRLETSIGSPAQTLFEVEHFFRLAASCGNTGSSVNPFEYDIYNTSNAAWQMSSFSFLIPPGQGEAIFFGEGTQTFQFGSGVGEHTQLATITISAHSDSTLPEGTPNCMVQASAIVSSN